MADETPAPAAGKPRILLVDDSRKYNYVLLIAAQIEIVNVTTWTAFDELIAGDTSGFAAAIVRPLVLTDEVRRRGLLDAGRALRAVFGVRPIITHENTVGFHPDLQRHGFNPVVRLPAEIEPLLAKLLGITPYPPVAATYERPSLSTGYSEALAAQRGRAGGKSKW